MKLIPALSVFLSLNAFAHVEYVGTIKGSTEPCSLEIEQTYFENNSDRPEDFRADVSVHLEDGDDHDKHGDSLDFTVKPSANPLVLNGVAANQKDQINILRKDLNGLNTPVSFALKWWHINHYHSIQCLNLKAVDHD